MNGNSADGFTGNLEQWRRGRTLNGLVALAPVAPLGTLAGCSALLVGLWHVVPNGVLTAWYNGGLLLIVVQVLMWHALDRAAAAPHERRRERDARRWFVLGSLSTGLYWCGFGMAVFPAESLNHQIFLACVVAGVTAVWLPFYALERIAVATVAAPALLPMASALLMTPSSPLMTMGSVLFVLFAVLLAVALVIRRVFDADDARQQALYHRATHDSLVGLVNRGEFHRRMQQLESAPPAPYAVVVIDLDHFKDVNDTAGHAEGDRVLREVGAIVREEIRKADTGARIGGDEFAVLMRLCTGQEARRVASAILARIGELPACVESNVTASIGIACSADVGSGAGSVLEAADRACYAAKRSGRNRIEMASPWSQGGGGAPALQSNCARRVIPMADGGRRKASGAMLSA